MAAKKPVLGHQTRAALGVETTWGTAVSRDRSFRVRSIALERQVPKEARDYLAHSAGSRNMSSHIRTADNAGGPVSMELGYEGFGIWLKYLMGSVATTGPSGSIYAHTYKLGLALNVGLTLEQIWYEAETPAYQAEVFEGCLVDNGTITLQVGKVATLDLDIIAETSGGITTATDISTTPYTTNDVPILFQQAGTFTYNSVALNVTSAKIMIKNGLTRRPLLGALTTAKPAPGRVSVTMQVDLEWDASTMDGALIADTEAAISIVCTGTASRTCTFTATKAYVESCGRPLSQAGIIKQSATLVLQSDGTNEGLNIVVENLQSSAVAV